MRSQNKHPKVILAGARAVANITISYRREDSGIIAGRIFDRLVAHYGAANVFRDIDNVPPGIDFRKYIDGALDRTDILLAIVGPHWIGKTADGRTRIGEPADLVRIEVETALRKDIPVVPVLVANATVPGVNELPDALKDFTYRHALKVDSLEDFDDHVRRLIRSLDRLLREQKQVERRAKLQKLREQLERLRLIPQRISSVVPLRIMAVATIIIGVIAVAFLVTRPNGFTPSPPPSVTSQPVPAVTSQPAPAVTLLPVTPQPALPATPQDASAMYSQGERYFNGWIVPQDYAKAREWYEKAAAGGNANAMFKLGALYDYGLGVPQDYAKAREWYEKAAAEDNAKAKARLQQPPFRITIVTPQTALPATPKPAPPVTPLAIPPVTLTPDFAKARESMEKAADMGSADAMVSLGSMYENGQGVAQDYAKAREWYEKAAAKGNVPAGKLLQHLPAPPVTSQDASALYSQGERYYYGQGVPQDYAKAREWYEKAAAKDDADAMFKLGLLYQNGQGVPQDYAKAREWYEKAAAKNNADAMYHLGMLYMAQDDTKARAWYEKAAAKNNADAMTNLGLIYQNGWGVAQDQAKAREWFEKAAGAKAAVRR
jgi:uncharacterized protein